VDAKGRTLGRLASQVAHALRGKNKPTYTPHIDTGDHVIVINADQVVLSGGKSENKQYFHHTMWPGGATWTTIQKLKERRPEAVVERAIRGMMPRTKLGRAMLKKLKVYAGPEHPHSAQQPMAWDPEHTQRGD
jgi:large subunit ribosomal protein L13